MMPIQGLNGVGGPSVTKLENRPEASAAERKAAADDHVAMAQNKESQKAPVDGDRVDRVVESLNNLAQSLKRKIEFSINDDTGQTVIRIVDSENDQVIRQIPPEEMLRLAEHLKDAQGLIVDSKA